MIIHTKAYPRAALIGNPSDGYFGKTIAFVFDAFQAEVVLFQTPELVIQPSSRDLSTFNSVRELVDDVNSHGYYGGLRLLKAAVKCFSEYCERTGIVLDERNFTLRYHSNIPHHVGLAGSSAIITACFRALMAFYHITIPKPVLANLILSVEKDELLISAGLQDRVVQVYQGLVSMDFNEDLMKHQGYGRYEYLDPHKLPPLFIAYRTDMAEGSEVFHNNIRERFNRGETDVVEAMQFWAGLTDVFVDALERRDTAAMHDLINKNFDRREQIYAISTGNMRMVQAARAAGASAKFSGSGGAIVGVYPDDGTFERLQEELTGYGIELIRPSIVTSFEE